MELPERTNEVTGLYAKQCIELAKEMGHRSIDLWSKMQETAGWQKKFLRFVMIEAFKKLIYLGEENSCGFLLLEFHNYCKSWVQQVFPRREVPS